MPGTYAGGMAGEAPSEELSGCEGVSLENQLRQDLHRPPAMCPQETLTASLRLSLLICKMEITMLVIKRSHSNEEDYVSLVDFLKIFICLAVLGVSFWLY